MDKFNWIGTEREAFPSKENMTIINSIDVILDRINANYDFKNMFEDIGCLGVFPKNIKDEAKFCFGNFRCFLNNNFSSVSRVNKNNLFPPFFYWVFKFIDIAIDINKKQMVSLLDENYEFYKDKIEKTGSLVYLKMPLYYDITQDKFINYL